MKSRNHRVATFVAGVCGLALLASIAPSRAQLSPEGLAAAAETAAIEHLDANSIAVGLNASDIADLRTTAVLPTSSGGHAVHLQQTVGGVDVIGAATVVVLGPDNTVLNVAGDPRTGVAKAAPSLVPATSASQAADAAARGLGLRPDSNFAPQRLEAGPDRQRALDDGGIADDPIQARLVLTDDGTGLKLAWELIIDEAADEDVWQVRIDAGNAQEIERDNLTSADSYTVYDDPTEAPSFGGRTTVVDPADPTASPFGWHDTDGLAGAEFTTTEGNNVTAYADTDSDQQPDPGRPDGGAGLDFDFDVDLSKEPIDSQAAAITNMFYWANRLHDITYAYGFDEASGNFQTNNYGRGGLGGDPLRAEAQDGFTTNNANFFTPPDGSPPRMQMYLFTNTSPERDSSFDNGFIAHEYMHGVADRLTGGPAAVTCLLNEEQPGEGWADWMAMMVTMQPGDIGATPRGFGTYLLGQPTTGSGYRSHPYTTNLAIDPRTYGTIVAADEPHGVGSVFAAMLWDLSWALIERDGFDPDLIGGTGGNITALQLVIDALKLQPCSPGFVDARDAILLADQMNNASANECLIWESFAGRGLGFSAAQGDTNDKTDGTQAFDVPPQCADLTLAVSPAPAAPLPTDTVTYTVEMTNNSLSALTGVTATAQIPSGSTYVPASATCAGSESGGVVTFGPGTIAASTTVPCTFQITVNPGPGTLTLVSDDAEAGLGQWTVSHGTGSADWAVTTTDSQSPTSSFLAAAPPAISDQYLTLTDPVFASAQTELRFAHRHVLENTWDGGVVEISTNGIDWADAGPLMTEGGYSDLLNFSPNPISGRLAFTGDSAGWTETAVDLSGYAGSTVQVRFRLGSDASVGSTGWFIDDVRIVDGAELHTTVAVVSNEGPNDEVIVSTIIDPSTDPGLLRVTTTPAVPAIIDVNGEWTDAFGLDWVEVPGGNYDLCWKSVPGFVNPPCETVQVLPGLTTVAQGDFVVQGTLDITTSPPVPSTITVNGSPVNDWGAINRVAPGTHNVCFGAVSGWDPPPCQSVAVTAGAITPVVGTFTPNGAAPGPLVFGNLRVTTVPAVPSQISIDGVGAQSFGLDWVKVAPGSHEICFSDVPGYATPPCETVVVVAGNTTVASGTFTQLAELRVLTSPPAGQPVTVDGRIIDQYGFWTWVPAGTYEICTAGYTCQTVNPSSGSLTTVTLTP